MVSQPMSSDPPPPPLQGNQLLLPGLFQIRRVDACDGKRFFQIGLEDLQKLVLRDVELLDVEILVCRLFLALQDGDDGSASKRKRADIIPKLGRDEASHAGGNGNVRNNVLFAGLGGDDGTDHCILAGKCTGEGLKGTEEKSALRTWTLGGKVDWEESRVPPLYPDQPCTSASYARGFASQVFLGPKIGQK
ncbi:hypothetical protein N0V85_002669 [Neurospora sp. IMI 360204]|nr:hypothetical protein N0V85_002669 [Neurospora sp. IMI 360204]